MKAFPLIVIWFSQLASKRSMAKAWASWSKLSPTSGSQPKVSGHACCDMGDDQRLLLFGGLLSDRIATRNVWIWTDGKWTQHKENNGPGPRMYATACRLLDKIYVIGGWDPEAKGSGGSFKDEIFAMDATSLQWSQLDPLPCGPISRHTSCTVGDVIVIHTYKEGDECVLVLQEDGTCRKQPTMGDVPTGISMCSAAALGNDKMVLYGGSTKTQEFSEFVYLLDTTTWIWSRLKSRGDQIPAALTSSCMAAVGDGETCLVFGGAGIGEGGYQGGAGLLGSDETWKLRVVDDIYAEWTKLESSKVPRARVAASLNRMPGETSKFLLTGGWDPATAETFDEPWTLELSSTEPATAT